MALASGHYALVTHEIRPPASMLTTVTPASTSID
jgi:hypothetical protein